MTTDQQKADAMRRIFTGILFALLLIIISACNLSPVTPTSDAGSNPTVEPTSVAVQPTSTTPPQNTSAAPPTDPPTAIPPATQPPTLTPIPTDTPAPDTPTNTPDPTSPPVDDSCLSAQGLAAVPPREPQRTLPNGRPFPGKAPLQINPEQAQAQGLSAQSARGTRDVGQPQIVIQFEPGTSAAERQQIIDEAGGRVIREIPALNSVVVMVNPGRGADMRAQAATDALSRTNANPRVRRSEPDYLAAAQQSVAIPPNDPRFSEQWGFSVVGLPDAWQDLDTSTPITIAVVDSGICANHPDLQGKIIGGYDFVEDDTNPADVFGHGCNVAGVIAAVANNGIGIAGAAPNVQVMPLRVLNELGVGSYSRIAEAIIYATDNGADIINLSLGAGSYSAVLEQAVQYARSQGVILIAAAGNYGQEGSLYPAAFDGVLSVGSVDPDLQRSDFSHYGANVDLYAPGRDILTTTLAGDYDTVTGTSFAAPLISGLTAIRPDLTTPPTTDDQIAYVPPPQVASCP